MKRLLIVGVCALVLGLSGVAHAMDAKQTPATDSSSHMSTPVKHPAPAKHTTEPAKHTTEPTKNMPPHVKGGQDASHEAVKK